MKRNVDVGSMRSVVWFTVVAAVLQTQTILTSAFTFPKTPTFVRSALGLSAGTESKAGQPFEYALIFDCDGVIIETEELHRLAYNAAFEVYDLRLPPNDNDNDTSDDGDNELGEKVVWSPEYYDVLQNTVGGGKGKMFYHFRNVTGTFPTYRGGQFGPPTTPDEEQSLVDELQALKTDLYKELVSEQAVPRPGVLALMDEALADPRCAVGVCSASTKAAVTKVLDVTLGPERRRQLDVCLLGDDVTKLKPDPMIYVTAAERLGMAPDRCVVVEDSMVGLKAAKGAGMKCLITYTSSTQNEDFYGHGCDAKVPDLASRNVTLDVLLGRPRGRALEDTGEGLLVGIKD